MSSDPTFLGTVQDVQGSTIGVALDEKTISGLAFVSGHGYRIGQIGSFVRISIGFTDLYGVVSHVGAGAVPESRSDDSPFGSRWLRLQLIGEGQRSGSFQRGISQYPTIGDEAHLVSESDLRTIYGPKDPQGYVGVGHLASSAAIPALVDINSLVTRHSAVVGTTGAGKSTTVAGLVASLSQSDRYPSARIMILDIHGEYASALKDCSTVFRIGAVEGSGERPLCIPYWALSFEELVRLGFDGLEGQRAATVAELILKQKREGLKAVARPGVSPKTATVDSPVPFSLHAAWLELHRREHHTVVPKPGGAADEREPAYVLDDDGHPVETGDAMSVTPPLYRTIKQTGTASERVQQGGGSVGIRQQVANLASRLRDPRFGFLFAPGRWLPDESGNVEADLDELLEEWIGAPTPITILDLSGVPSPVLRDLVGALLRIVYDALFWARKLPEGGRERPLLLVLEEAHAYLSRGAEDAAGTAVRRIAREGRKYGVGMMLVSQRPSEIDSTVLSQCGTLFAMRLTNDADRSHVSSAASENLKGLFEMLPALRTGEAIIVGEGVALPIRAQIDPPPKGRKPDSDDPRAVVRGSLEADGFDGAGGWNQKRDISDYGSVLRLWRRQNPDYDHDKSSD